MQTASTSFRHFNDESPLGLRQILSQSTDSLNMRSRTLSVESLIDEGEQTWPRGEVCWQDGGVRSLGWGGRRSRDGRAGL